MTATAVAVRPPRTVAAPASPPPRPPHRFGPGVLTGAGVGLWTVAVVTATPGPVGDLGLAGRLGWPYAAAVLAVAGALAWELARPRPRPIAPVVALVVILFATAPAVEGVARLPTSWVHAGFVDYIAVHGQVLHGYDARFSWPGFFAWGAVLESVTGHRDPAVFLRWAPVVVELAYLAPLVVIARATVRDARAGWIGIVLFYAADWIDQDYFSPQAMNLLFFLVVVASVLAFWRPRPPVPEEGGPVARWRHGLGRVDGTLGGRRQIGLEALLLVLMAACVASHQFTPYALVVALFACMATRRLPGPELPLILVVMAVGWLSLATVDFWSGHLSLLFGGTGSLRAALGQNIGQRVTGAPAHRAIIDLRLALAAAVAGLAVAGALRRRGQSRTLEALAACPFLLFGVASYGGEALLRCFLFALPFAGLLAGTLLAGLVRPAADPGSGPVRRLGVLGLAAVVTTFSLGLTVVRGGNDAFESFTPAERAAVLVVYQAARPGDRLAATTPATDQLPWRDEGLGRWRFVDPATALSPGAVADSLVAQRADWVIAAANEEKWGELVGGLAPGWQAVTVADLRRDGYAVVGRWPGAVVLHRSGVVRSV